jgi:hypothetical protein
MRRFSLLAVGLIAVLGCTRVSVASSTPAPTAIGDPRLDRLIADYVGLWRRETLDQWETLFLPSFAVANTRSDGTTNLRTREQFFEAQRSYHARVAGLREDLENVRVERRGRLASVWADFVVTEGANKNRGRLALLVIDDKGEYKIHSLMFSYDP